MKRISGSTFRVAGVCLLMGVSSVAGVPGHADAAALLFNDFSSTAGLQLNGVTAVLNPGGAGVTDLHGHKVLRLTNNLGQSGSAFSTTAISLDQNASFSTAFKFHFTDQQNGGADGIVFVIQTVANTAGGGGGGIGYQNLMNSVGIEFDNWFNGGLDPNDNHVGIDLNGNVASAVTSIAIPFLDSGATFTAWVDYDGVNQLLEVRTNTTGVRPVAPLLSLNVNLVNVLGQTNAFVGFTSGTGAAGADHDIVSWQFNSTFNPITEIGVNVPEPGTLALLGFGLAGLGFARRRKAA